MIDEEKSREELISELTTLRKKINSLENGDTNRSVKQSTTPEITDACTNAILESINDVVFIHDAGTGKILDVNTRVFDIYGYTPEEAKKLSILQLSEGTSPYSQIEILQHLAKASAEGPQKFDWLAKHKDGHSFWVEVSMRFSFLNNHDVIIATIRDITERKKIIQEISESEMRFEALTTASFGGIVIHENGVVLDCNQTLSDMTGYSVNELIGIDGVQLIAPEYRELIYMMIREMNDKVYTAEGLKKDGSRFKISVRGKSMPYKGKIARVAEFRDITTQKEVEENLMVSEERFRLMTENISDVIVEIDESGKYSYISPSFQKVCGMGNEVLGTNAFAHIHPEDMEYVHREFLKGYHDGVDTRVEYRFYHPVKGYLWVESAGKPYIDRHGKKIALIVSRDITERKRAEALLKESEASYRGLLNSVAEAIYILDEAGFFIEVNEGAVQMYGLNKVDLVGKTPADVGAPGRNDLTKTFQALQEAFNGKPQQFEFWGIRKNGQIFPKDVRLSKGTYFGKDIVIAVAFDITERKQAEFELVKAKEKAEEMSRIKSSFLSNMSHELRTPLIGILGYSDLLKEMVQDADERRMVTTIFYSGERLLNTLNMILNLSKIEANKIDIIKTKINLYESTKENLKLFEPLAQKKNITLEIIKPETDVLVYGDIYMIDSIVNNLVNNAVKYTRQGGVTVKISQEVAHHVAWSVISVTDTGIGIPEAAQKYIFDEFRQGSEGFGRAFEGSGLGLTVAKKYVEILGGEVTMESKAGIGSTFTVKLPSDVQGEQKNSGTTEGGQLLNDDLPEILLVDDDLTTYGVVKYMTSKLCLISHAKNGNEAIDMIRQKKYRVVLLDINLGLGLNGFDVLKEIKVTPGYEFIPVVALTAYAMAGDRQRFLDAGCQYYLSKPFRKSDLLEQIQTALSGETTI